MPYHGERKMNGKGRKVLNPNTNLTDKEQDMLRKHSDSQTPKHMALMNNLMKSGDSFEEAHKKASKMKK